MKRTTAEVRGDGAGAVAAAIETALAREGANRRVIRFGATTVLAVERYFMRTHATVLGLLFVHAASEDLAEVEILSGGGASLYGITWGAHSAGNGRFVRLIEDVCRDRSLEVRVHDR
jgi:hypothetical protein